MEIKKQITKTLAVKDNNNSSDAISPNYIYGCLGGCGSYCYMKRYNTEKVFVNQNVNDIHRNIEKWVENKEWPKVPNQQDDKYYMIDIGCNTDMSLMQKYINLYDILKFYDDNEKLNSTFATKYPNMLNLDVSSFNKPPRMRISIMPQVFSNILEPNTDSIIQRIHCINKLKSLGWEVHLNFSPVVVYHEWLERYKELFEYIVANADLTNVKSEIIFLTNHKASMERATDEEKELLQHSSEVKNESGVMRYPIKYKNSYVKRFKKLHNEILKIPIRYEF